MRNILLVAKREFVATVGTRAFVFGLLFLPALIALFAWLGPRLFNPKDYQLKGEIIVIDPTGQVLPGLRDAYDPEKIRQRREQAAKEALAKVPQQVRDLADKMPAGDIGLNLTPLPDLRILTRPAGTDIEKEKAWLNIQPKDMPHLAIAVIHPNAVQPTGESPEYGTYDFYVSPNLSDMARSEIQDGLKNAIVNARLNRSALDGSEIYSILGVPSVRSVTVTQTDQRQTVQGFNTLLPLAFGFLLLMGVMGGGGQLLTTMVEEKSSRVVEVLLSAVSPMELMAGKLMGQMGASMIGMGLYILMGVFLLSSFAMVGLFDFSLIFYLLLFFVITYLVMGSLMMAVGSAVNDMKEAQGLMMPLSLTFMVPWILWFPISRSPDSVLSVVVSFIPPVNTFAILLRMASSSPPPLWQVWLSILIGFGSVIGAVWFTAKIFRIGLLMFGKPPNFRTLLRWVRSA
ncbi:MAG: ABC transporter permease [Acidobacteria bacterium]|nr:ABC transporter permease [Acidobacteriota bacterium]